MVRWMSESIKEEIIDSLLKKFSNNEIHDQIRDHLTELFEKLPESIIKNFTTRDGASKLPRQLKELFNQEKSIDSEENQRTWEKIGLWFYKFEHRYFEAAQIFLSLYEHLCKFQDHYEKWVSKGTPLVWISDCFKDLGFIELSKRYLMLSMIEDAIKEKGKVLSDPTGSYFRLVWIRGMKDEYLQKYSKKIYEIYEENTEYGKYPEWILQNLDHSWLIEIPSPNEAFCYYTNPNYIDFLLSKTGDNTGKALEYLADYLMSCMPGVKSQVSINSNSSEYDVICSMDGFQIDFRSEFGRYFLCECKDWRKKADFSVFAKFCRILDSIKAKFGVLFSNDGITGVGRLSAASLEQIKVFQDRGMVIVVIDKDDIERIKEGENLIHLMRNKYEKVRLDIR
jgi:hypothetical protein